MATDKLPLGWTPTTLGEICTKPQYGWTTKAKKNGVLKYIRTTDISTGKINWPSVPYCDKAPNEINKYKVWKDDILIARAGSVGVSYRIQTTDTDAVFASYLIRFRPHNEVIPAYIELYLNTNDFWNAISENSAGIAIPNVNASKLSKLEIPLPPYEEQRRIVAKLEKLLAKVDACKERLKKIPAILKRFRQSVLAAACLGQLTREWRRGKLDFQRSGAKQGETNFVAEHTLTLPTVPQSWNWLRLEELCSKDRSLTYGVIKLGAPHRGGIPTLRSSDVRWLNIDLSNVKKIAPEIANEYGRTFLKGGEVLITVRGSLGGVAFAPESVKGFNISREVAMIPLKEDINPHYISCAIASNWSQNWLAEVAKGVAYTGINIRDLKLLPIPLPPVLEQHEIVRRVEALFKIADDIEKRYQKAKAHVEKLTQAILAKAFRGELVPQDPNDEPASELLKRIQAERKNQETEARPGRRGIRRKEKAKSSTL